MERQLALGTLYGPERIVKAPDSKERLGYRYYHFSTVNAAIRTSAWEATRFPDELKVFEDVAMLDRPFNQPGLAAMQNTNQGGDSIPRFEERQTRGRCSSLKLLYLHADYHCKA
jgi:hypothetical protein